MNLYELKNAKYQVLQMEEEMDQKTFLETLESIDEAIEDKLVNIGYVFKNMNANIEAIKSEEKRLAEKRKTLENKVSNLKEYALEGMEARGIKKASDGVVTVSIRKNAPSLSIDDTAAIPKDYLIEQEPKLDKRGLLKAVKEGLEVEGVHLVQKEGVTIK